MYLFELSKFTKNADELDSDIDKWAYFFKTAPKITEEDLAKILKNYPIMKKAFNELDEKSYSKEELEMYNRAKIEELDRLSNEKQIRLEGINMGKIEGLAQSLLLILQEKFGNVSKKYSDIITSSSSDQLSKLIKKAIVSNNLRDIFEE